MEEYGCSWSSRRGDKRTGSACGRIRPAASERLPRCAGSRNRGARSSWWPRVPDPTVPRTGNRTTSSISWACYGDREDKAHRFLQAVHSAIAKRRDAVGATRGSCPWKASRCDPWNESESPDRGVFSRLDHVPRGRIRGASPPFGRDGAWKSLEPFGRQCEVLGPDSISLVPDSPRTRIDLQASSSRAEHAISNQPLAAVRMTLASAEEDRRRLALYRALAETWNHTSVSYGIVNGLSPVDPEWLGRDLDVLVDSEDLGRAVELTVEIMTELEWRPVVKRRPWTTLITGIADFSSKPFSVEIDLFSSQRWFNVRLVDGPRITVDGNTDGVFRFDSWGAFAKQVLLQVLGGDTVRLEREPRRLRLDPASERVISDELSALLGDSLGRATLDAVKSRNFAWLEGNQYRLRRRLAVRALQRRPALTLADSFAWARDELTGRFLADRAAPIVAVVGPDGIGKTSAIRELERILKSRFRFVDVELRHWRPGVLPPLQRLRQPRSRPDLSGTSPPRREGGRSLIPATAVLQCRLSAGSCASRPAAGKSARSGSVRSLPAGHGRRPAAVRASIGQRSPSVVAATAGAGSRCFHR